jgi:hypothetical protein
MPQSAEVIIAALSSMDEIATTYESRGRPRIGLDHQTNWGYSPILAMESKSETCTLTKSDFGALSYLAFIPNR